MTCEVTPHHFALTDKEMTRFDSDFKMNPPLRSQADLDAVLEALADGTVDAIATDHAPHGWDDKEVRAGAAPPSASSAWRPRCRSPWSCW